MSEITVMRPAVEIPFVLQFMELVTPLQETKIIRDHDEQPSVRTVKAALDNDPFSPLTYPLDASRRTLIERETTDDE